MKQKQHVKGEISKKIEANFQITKKIYQEWRVLSHTLNYFLPVLYNMYETETTCERRNQQEN